MMEHATVSQSEKPTEVQYQNNPFMIAIDGLNLLFKLAQSVAIFAIILCVFSVGSGFTSPNSSASETTLTEDSEALTNSIASISPEMWAAIALALFIVLTGFFIIGSIISGIFDYTAAQLAKNRQVTLKEAFFGTIKRFGGYVWLRIIIAVKTFLWSLLLIIPGIVMSYRYSLAGVAFFAEDAKASDSVKRSLALTKGAWLTTYASQSLFNMITLGVAAPILTPGTTALLYRQYAATPGEKPPAHVLSWLALFIPFVLFFLFVLAVAVLLSVLANQSLAI